MSLFFTYLHLLLYIQVKVDVGMIDIPKEYRQYSRLEKIIRNIRKIF